MRKPISEPFQRADGRVVILVECSCGARDTVRLDSFRKGAVACRPCSKKGNAYGATHGQHKSRTYASWRAMINRCENPKEPGYDYYGGRGITVCSRWRESFEDFLADLGERPSGKTLDRFPDKDGNYEPGNCRWATPAEQLRNTRATKLTSDIVNDIRQRFARGETQADIARQLNLRAKYVHAIVRGHRWHEDWTLPRSKCPGNRRGHTWREPSAADDLKVLSTTTLDHRAIRVCKRCGRLGCVSDQGVIKEVP